MTRTLAWARLWTALRAVMAVVILAAVFAQLGKSLATAAADGKDMLTIVTNFFSFFTILSNVLAAVVLLISVVWFVRRRPGADAFEGDGTRLVEPAGLATAIACVSTYMIITGLVYNTLLRSITLPQGSEPIPWSNETMHLIGPLFLLADVFLGPARRSLPWSRVLAIIVFPIVWVVYTLLRGPLITNPANDQPFWYPYPFLNPNNPGGWGSVVIYVILISIAFIVVGSIVVGWRRRTGARVTA
ncbi:Pr6Pr family membrane protein [Microbacterium sp. 1P10UB]|uniref:Pr6Pr family membrane protein n=1 Tax=unclassified Microbacterium TaxID=2609290 RepID=UPI0039A0EC57